MEEERYTIIRIDEDDYGCEARPDDYVPMVRVLIRAVEPNEYGDYAEETIMMEDALMYTRNLDEGSEAVIGYDGELYPPGMLCNEEAIDDINEELADDRDVSSRQSEWLENYLDAVTDLFVF